jgi:sugar phosphate isomerase/epimerase
MAISLAKRASLVFSWCKVESYGVQFSQVDHLGGLSDSEALDLMKRSYNQIMEVAKAHNITVTIEGHGYFTTNPDMLEKMFAFTRSSNLGLNMDTGNAFIAGQDPVNFIKRILPKVQHVHVKNVSVCSGIGVTMVF